MKTERRHELATNELADWLGERIEAIKPYSTAISATVLAVAVAIFAYVYWSQKNQARQAHGWEMYFKALDERGREDADESLLNVAEQYAHAPAGNWSRLSLADAQLAKGVDQLFNDRAASRQTLDDAAESYRAVLDDAPADSPLAERASFGLAEAYESKNELDKAREQYQSLVNRWPNGAFTALAQERLNDLDQKSTKDFYDWFAKQSPKPKAPKGPGKPGEKPAFDLGNLSDESPFGSSIDFGRKEPASKEPASKEPASKEPTNDEPATKEPAANAPRDEPTKTSLGGAATEEPPTNEGANSDTGADPASSLGGQPDK